MASVYKTYSGTVDGEVVIQGDLIAQGNINIVTGAARSMFQSLLDCPEAFGSMQSQIRAMISDLVAVLLVTDDYTRENRLDAANRTELAQLAEACQCKLDKLEELKTEFDRWGTQSLREEELSKLTQSFKSEIEGLEGINGKIRASTVELEKMLRRYIADVKNGQRASSISSSVSTSSLNTADERSWTQLRKELQSTGIHPQQLDQHRGMIIKILQEAFTDNEALPEPNLEDQGNRNSGTTARVPPNKKASQLSRLLSSMTGKSGDLLNATRSGNLSDVMSALQKGAHINTQNSKGLTPLALAAKEGSKLIVEVLLHHHADSNKTDKLGNTPLHYAIINNHLEIVRALLRDNAGVNQADKVGVNPLHLAVLKNNIEVAQALLECKALIDQADMFKFTPLQYAVCLNRKELIIILLSHGANVNKRGSSPKKIPSPGRHALYDILINSQPDSSPGANIGACASDLENTWRFTSALAGPLFYVVSMGDDSLAERFLDCGANTEKNMEDSGDRVLHRAIRRKEVKMVQLLLERKAKVNPANKDGFTPLHLALKVQQEDIIRLLIACDPDVNTAAIDGETPLHTATKNGDAVTVEALLTHGAKVVSREQEPPLHIAARGGYAAIIRLLLKHGAPVNERLAVERRKQVNFIRERKGTTPLWQAAAGGHLGAAKLLVDGGADIHQRAWPEDCSLHSADQCLFASMAIWQCNPVHIAAAHGHQKLASFLIQKGGELNAWVDFMPASRQEDDEIDCERKILCLAAKAKVSRLQKIQLLLNLGAGINERSHRGFTALHCVAGAVGLDADENARVIKMLIANGADVNFRDDLQSTPLHHAVKWDTSQSQVVEALIKNGADPNAKDTDDWTPIEYARNSNDPLAATTIRILHSSSIKIPDRNIDGFTGNLLK